MAISVAAKTRLGSSGFPRQRYGSFAGKAGTVAAVGGIYPRIRRRRRK